MPPRDERAPRPPASRVAEALAAALAIACLLAGPAKSQPREGFPATTATPADPRTSTPIEVAILVEGGAVVCRPDFAPLPADRPLQLQIVNQTNGEVAFSAPDLLAGAGVASVVDARHDPETNLVSVPPGRIGIVVLSRPQAGEYPFECAAADAAGSGGGLFRIGG